MNWYRSWRAEPRAREVADRHYNRQKIGARQFVPPGGCLVLATATYGAVWVTSTPLAEYVKHEWAGAWVNSMFRNESRDVLSSVLITEAVAATRAAIGDPPERGWEPVEELPVGVQGPIRHRFMAGGDLDGSGMLIEYDELKRIVAPIVALVDHHELNTLSERCSTHEAALVAANPTAERLADWFGARLSMLLESARPGQNLHVLELLLRETSTAAVVWRP